jgi:hypothetical protein
VLLTVSFLPPEKKQFAQIHLKLLKCVIIFIFLWYWDFNSKPTPIATPPTRFLWRIFLR